MASLFGVKIRNRPENQPDPCVFGAIHSEPIAFYRKMVTVQHIPKAASCKPLATSLFFCFEFRFSIWENFPFENVFLEQIKLAELEARGF
jgi:hypothetical protein